jgi:endonuclease/exonuclease/phosphatase family metal-dependent hydrolase
MPDKPGSIRVISYNLHNGFDIWGHLDPEALAQVIEAEQPDIVALQEVSRGWALNGSLDMLSWLSRRLGLAYIYAPASDVLWGHAVLSRYPILLVENHPLPPRDLPLKRGFAYVQIDIGQPEPLQLINTHLHHVIEDSAIRVTQSETMLGFISNHQFNQFIMTGDLNATPNAPEIQLLYEHGFNDVVTDANLKPGYTFSSLQPYKRLDYILIAPDLTASNAVIPDSTASDHLAIGATLNRTD